MNYHPNSAPLKRYLLHHIDQLVSPHEYHMLSKWKPGDNEVTKAGTLFGFAWDFKRLAIQLSNRDGNVSESAMALCADISNVLYGDEYQHESPIELRRQALKNLRDRSDVYGGLNVPSCISDLEEYDKINNTNYADKAKVMFYHFAEAFVKADGNLTYKEEQALSDFKDLLYPRDYHPDSAPLKQRVIDTLEELLEPLEQCLRAEQDPGNEEVSGLFHFAFCFQCLSFQLSNSDGDVSESAMALCADTYNMLCKDGYKKYSPKEFRHKALKDIREKPDFYGSLSVPMCVSYLEGYDRVKGTNYADKAKAVFFLFANVFVNADGKVTRKEELALSSFKDLLYPPAKDDSETQDMLAVTPQKIAHREESRSLEDLLGELNNLIGLDTVKTDVIQLVNFLKIQQMRQAKGMPTVPISRHLVFFGSPGTGKTTVARLIAQVYKSLGIISRGHMVETDRSGLVAGYVGQTALKVKEVVQTALGGVLFIDEAYALTSAQRDEFGQEAIDTLLKLMEDNRDDLIVIVAGYTDKMNNFLTSNPGFKSRFNKFFCFADYSPEQLVSIYQMFCIQAGFTISSQVQKKLLLIFQSFHKVRDETFGNARLVRNVFEQTINNQANRIISLADISEESLSIIEVSDVPSETCFINASTLS
jgi:Holliday junction resolvasome RuvABC ATP-dependent DNA helicase subunit